jgi:hypothetical protein
MVALKNLRKINAPNLKTALSAVIARPGLDVPIGIGKNVLAQMMADEAVDAKNENIFQDEPLKGKILKSMRTRRCDQRA